jgi:NAD-dependent deacetylase
MDIPWRDVRSVAVLTGAGISAESGVPTFRGEDGLWRNYRAENLATPDAFYHDPQLVWEWYDWRRGLIADCRPNAAHHTLAHIERHFEDWTLITQNVDGLHQMADSRSVVELHGSIWRMRCTQGCQAPWEDRTVPLAVAGGVLPRCTRCGSLARPDVVWFGESLPGEALAAALAAAQRCQVMLVVGTSAVVHPAASLPLLALRRGAYVVEINPQPTPLSDAVHEVIREPATLALPQWCQAWQRRVSVS